MAYMITDECISCGACEADCPNQAITEGETTYEINQDRCTECVGAFESPRCVDVCPVEATVLDASKEESKEQLLEKWKKLHPNEEPAAGTF